MQNPLLVSEISVVCRY